MGGSSETVSSQTRLTVVDLGRVSVRNHISRTGLQLSVVLREQICANSPILTGYDLTRGDGMSPLIQYTTRSDRI